MNDIVAAATRKLAERISGFEVSVKFVIEGEGSIMIDHQGIYAGDAPAEITMTATREVFERLFDGRLNPMTAVMGGKIRIDGSMKLAMQLGKALATKG